MNNPDQVTNSNRVNYRLQSMRDTFYWFREKIHEFQHEFNEDSDALKVLASFDDYHYDLAEELKQVDKTLHEFEKHFSKIKRYLRHARQNAGGRILSTMLPAAELSQLNYINDQLEAITAQIGNSATEIGASLDDRLSDLSDCLWDYEMEAEVSFVLRDDDPGYSDDSDNFLTTLDLHMFERKSPATGWEIHGLEWPEGYEFDPFPHGRLFHELWRHCEATTDCSPVNLNDILRIGGVWCDLVVRYQFYYDITQGKWIKSFVWTDDERQIVSYVQDKVAP